VSGDHNESDFEFTHRREERRCTGERRRHLCDQCRICIYSIGAIDPKQKQIEKSNEILLLLKAGIAFQTNTLASTPQSRRPVPASKGAASPSSRAKCATWRSARPRRRGRSKRWSVRYHATRQNVVFVEQAAAAAQALEAQAAALERR
jgi:hypothetical protein